MLKKTETNDGKFSFLVKTTDSKTKKRLYSQPFENRFARLSIAGVSDPAKPCEYLSRIEYKKRDGGSFIYCNNPEMLSGEDIGRNLLREKNISGECIFTLEHSNHTGSPLYLGFQLLNTGSTDITVKVTNIGYQVEGEWLGQREWSDYFGLKPRLPEDYFFDDGSVNPIYFGGDYIDYEPYKYIPQTIVIPAGEYIYVIGGTTADAYNAVNIGETANRPVRNGCCANGVVKFTVSGGSAQGTFFCYADASQIRHDSAEQGYITERGGKQYGLQYKGTDYKQGLIESNPVFIVNDMNIGRLPVRYTQMSDPNYKDKTSPYQKLDIRERVIFSDSWLTGLNPNYSDAIGADMSVFNCVDTKGNHICIDTESNDGTGALSNIGNWMIQYTDNFTFINTGEKDRIFKIYKRGSGGLLTIVRAEDGRVLDSFFNVCPYSFDNLESVFEGIDKSLLQKKDGRYYMTVSDGRPYCDVSDERALVHTLNVPAGEVGRVSIDFVVPANVNGGVRHWIEVV